jgi:hypothetical protein
MSISHSQYSLKGILARPPITESDPTKTVPPPPTIQNILRDTPSYLRISA